MDMGDSIDPTDTLRVIADKLAEVASGHGTEMSMRWKKIGDAGAEQIARGLLALPKPNELRKMGLCHNQIGDLDATALARSLDLRQFVRDHAQRVGRVD
jgi:hypothetical protein